MDTQSQSAIESFSYLRERERKVFEIGRAELSERLGAR
jgi:hypothetical protein